MKSQDREHRLFLKATHIARVTRENPKAWEVPGVLAHVWNPIVREAEQK